MQGEAALRGEEERLARQRREAQVREAQEKLARIKANLKEGEAQQQVGSLTLILAVPATRHVLAGSFGHQGQVEARQGPLVRGESTGTP